VKITEVRVSLCNEERLKAFANITFDDEFVVRGLKVIKGHNGYFVSMPSRRRSDGTYQDIAHPINNEMRSRLEGAVMTAYREEIEKEGGEVDPEFLQPTQTDS
jgi:stage V sporulation protein G